MSYILKHKVLFVVALLIILGGGYYGYKKFTSTTAAPSYVLAAVEKGTIITSVSGSGQVSASNQVDVKPKASGDVLTVSVKNGDVVKAGQTLAQLNARDALQTVRDAQNSLDTAKLSLEKLTKATDPLSLLQAEDALTQAQESQQNATADLKKAYDDGFNTVANAFVDIPSIMTGLHDILLGYDFSSSQDNKSYYSDSVKNYDPKAEVYRDDAYNAYIAARTAYDQNFSDYKTANRSSDAQTTENLIQETYNTVKKMAESVKITNNFILFYQDKLSERNISVPSLSNTHLASLSTYTSKTNTHLSNLLSITQTIKNDKDTIVSSGRTIAEKTQSLADLKAGADPLDIRSQQLAVQQRQNALADAQGKLSDYTIRAPFDGVIAVVSVKKGDTLSSGTAAFTMITQQKIAGISLNEVDVAKVKVGQKVNITFDAVSDLNITGEVSDIDLIGTVSQGVVSYNVRITFDTQDDRVKAGMSLSTAIITATKQDVLLVPNSAVKTQGNSSYVNILPGATVATGSQGVASSATLVGQTVEIGLADDTNTEIVSGLKEGDLVITKTITSATKTTAAPSLLQSIGGNRGGGAAAGGAAAGRALGR